MALAGGAIMKPHLTHWCNPPRDARKAKAMMPNYNRIVKQTRIKGVFSVPMFVHITGQPDNGHFKIVEVSTVSLDNAHLESPIAGMMGPEHGYETMVFLGGGGTNVYCRKYKTKRAARTGHDKIVTKLLAGKLPLSIQLGWYSAWDEEPIIIEESETGPQRRSAVSGNLVPSALTG